MKKLMALFLSLVMVMSTALPAAAADAAPPEDADQSVTPFKLGGGDKGNLDGSKKEAVEQIVLNFAPGATGFEGDGLETVTFTKSNGQSAVAPDVKDVVESDGFVSRSFLNWQCPTDGNRAYIIQPGEALNFESLELKIRQASMTTHKEMVFDLSPVFQDNLPDRSVCFSLDPAQGKWDDGTAESVSLAVAAGKSVTAPVPAPVVENTKFLHWQAVDAAGQPIEGVTVNGGESISYTQLNGAYEGKDRSYVQAYVAVFGEQKFEIQKISVDFEKGPAGFVGAGNNAKTMIRGDKGKYRIPSAAPIKDKDRFITDNFVEWVYEAEGKTITLSYGADETFSFDLLERKLQDSGMTLTEEMTLLFKPTFTPVERARNFTFVLDPSRGRFADGYKNQSRSESVSASHSLAAYDVIPTNNKQVFCYWQGLDEQNHNAPISGLVFRPGEMITYERMSAAMEGKRGDMFVQFTPVFAEKTTIYVSFECGKTIMKLQLDVPKGSETVESAQLLKLLDKLPPDYLPDPSVTSYPIDHNVIHVPLIEVRDMTITYLTRDGTVVGTQVIPDVPQVQRKLTITPPENYVPLGGTEINIYPRINNVEVYVDMMTRQVKVYLMEGDRQIGEPLLYEIPVIRETLSGETICDNFNMPDDYVLVDKSAEYPIGDGEIRVPVQERTRNLTVSFVDESEKTVGTITIDGVKYSATSITVTAPENYELVGSGTIAIDKTVWYLDVPVRVKTHPVTISFTAGDQTVGEPISAEISVLVAELNAEQLKALGAALPEGYELADPEAAYAITEGAVQIPLQEKTRDIVVHFITEDKTTVENRTIEDVKYSQKTLTLSAPRFYELAEEDKPVEIDAETTELTVVVKKQMVKITLQFVEGDKGVGKPIALELFAGQQSLTKKDIEDLKIQLPANYQFAGNDEFPIENGIVKVAVKYVAPVAPQPADPKNPKTGDDSNIGAFALLAAVSGTAAAALVLKKRKED